MFIGNQLILAIYTSGLNSSIRKWSTNVRFISEHTIGKATSSSSSDPDWFSHRGFQLKKSCLMVPFQGVPVPAVLIGPVTWVPAREFTIGQVTGGSSSRIPDWMVPFQGIPVPAVLIGPWFQITPGGPGFVSKFWYFAKWYLCKNKDIILISFTLFLKPRWLFVDIFCHAWKRIV